jgi:poly(A) polymerase
LNLNWKGINVVLLLARRIHDLPLASASGGIVQDTAGCLAYEISETILNSVPNHENFMLLLRFVRFWAKRRGVYGSVFGYFSGTAWAICCAVVCQQHPRLQLPQLVGHFFRMLSRHDWATQIEIIPPDGQPRQAEKLPPAEECPMPVLLPAGSGLLATRTVSPTTMKVLQKELRRGFKTVKQVELARVHWSDVYNSSRFFQRHRHYLEFSFMAASQEVFDHWLVWAQHQVETVVRLFESTSKDIVSLRPWPEWLDFKDQKWNCSRAIFMGLHLDRGKDGAGQTEGGRRSFDLREPIVKFLESTAAWPYADRYANQFELEIRHLKNDQLQQWLDNRDQDLPARSHSQTGGLMLQTLGEKVSVYELPEDTEVLDSL